MLKRMVNALRGSVRLEVSGAFPERFLNLCAQRGIVFWNVEWLEATRLRLTVTRQGSGPARALGDKVLCTVVPAEQSGVPFFLGRFRRRYALLVGLALSLTAVCVLSQFVLTIEVEGNEEHINDIARDVLCVTAKGKPIKPKTLGQKRYVDAIKKNTITLGIGPAGTGKTYLAVAAAVAAFRDKQVNRIILTRPAVEAGERLGFLPGDLQSKVDPYLRPLYDALFDMLGAETYNKYLERGSIEVAPLAYMRGRTLDDSFIILDEAQNTSREQMKMFLTRLGFGSKIVITGDITQIDLPRDTVSGLKEAMRVLDGVEDIALCRLNEADVVRHVIVQRIIKAYEEDEKRKGKR